MKSITRACSCQETFSVTCGAKCATLKRRSPDFRRFREQRRRRRNLLDAKSRDDNGLRLTPAISSRALRGRSLVGPRAHRAKFRFAARSRRPPSPFPRPSVPPLLRRIDPRHARASPHGRGNTPPLQASGGASRRRAATFLSFRSARCPCQYP